jgi:hypothetical protein
MKKKSGKQLDKEIAAALRPRPMSAAAAKVDEVSFPSLRVTVIRPDFVDEWYGVHVAFQWAKPFNEEAYRAAVRAEERSWFEAQPPKMHVVGGFPLEKAMGEHLRREIGRSPQWIEFFSKPQKGIGRFDAKAIDNWEFDAHGGWASASDRD